MNEQPVLDVVDLSTLEYETAEDQVERFERTWGVPPAAVALPVLLPNGVPFENDFVEALGIRYGGASPKKYLGGIAYEFAKLGLDVMLTVTPTMQFVRSDSLHVIDITGAGSPQACIAKAATRRLLARLIEQASEKVRQACDEAAQHSPRPPKLAGLALDLVDVWGMGAEDERISLVCFCQECREQLGLMSKKGRRIVEAFERFPNPWNLVLRDSGSGIQPISELRWGMPAKAIVDLSHLKGFDKIHDRAGLDVVHEAELLMEYMQARHRQVVQVAAELFADAQRHGLSRIVIVEGELYGWTSGVFIEQLDTSDVCDELWYDPTEQGLTTSRIPFRSYMWRRCRYFLDNFFDFVAKCQDEEKRTATGLARYPDSRVRHILELRRRQVMAARLSEKLDLFCLPPLADGQGGRIGFVGASVSPELSTQIVGNVKLVTASPDLIEED